MRIYDFLVMGQKYPLGIGKNPYFSWKLESEKSSVMQVAYRLCVCEKSRLIWDSGMVQGDQNAFVAYGGPELKSRENYQVSVTVWNNYGEIASAENGFEMALLEKNDWKGQWVQPVQERKRSEIGFGNQDPPTLFQKSFVVMRMPVKARLYSTCHGIYHAYVNRCRCELSQFAPEHTMYEKYLCYQTTDVLAYIKEGKNNLEMYVSDGWMFCHQSRVNKSDMEDAHSILFQLELEFEDHTTQMICSDEQVEWSYGPVQASDLFAGELYDANKKEFQWKACKFSGFGV